MATTLTNLMTAEQFYDWAQRPENRDRNVELERGEIVEMPPPRKVHGFVCANISRILGNYAAESGRGYVCSNDSGVLVERDPDTVRGPDLMFFLDDQTLETMDPKYAVRPPVLAVEVLSPEDGMNRRTRRVTELLKAGVAMVWVVDPAARDVGVHRSAREPQVIEKAGELMGDDVLDGFHCSIAEFFAAPGAKPGQGR